MNDKQQIEEMAKVIADIWLVDLEGNTYDICEVLDEVNIKGVATELYEQGYRKPLKDAVVLTREEYLQDFNKQFNRGYEKGSKETAKEILKELYMHFSADNLCGIVNFNKHYNSAKVVARLARQYRVEIKE